MGDMFRLTSALSLASVEFTWFVDSLGGGGRAGGTFLEGPLLGSAAPSCVFAGWLVVAAVGGGVGLAGSLVPLPVRGCGGLGGLLLASVLPLVAVSVSSLLVKRGGLGLGGGCLLLEGSSGLGDGREVEDNLRFSSCLLSRVSGGVGPFPTVVMTLLVGTG